MDPTLSSDDEIFPSKIVVKNVSFEHGEDAGEELDKTKEGTRLRWSMFALSAIMMWSYYQNALSSIFVYQKLFPDSPDVSFTQILLSTLPESIPTVLLYVLGLHRTKWLGFSARIHLSSLIFFISAIVYIVGIYTAPNSDTLLSIIYAVTVSGAVGQFLCEPALYEISGIIPTKTCTQFVTLGTAASGVVNWALPVIIRLLYIASTGININDDVDTATYKNQQAIFVAFLALGGILMPIIWRYGIATNTLYQRYVILDASLREGSQTAPSAESASEGAETDGVPVVDVESAVDKTPMAPWRIFDGSSEMMEALTLVWPRFLALFLLYLTSLTIFPNTVMGMCGGFTSPIIGAWWADLLVGSYNIFDFIFRFKAMGVGYFERTFGGLTLLAMVIFRSGAMFAIIGVSAYLQAYPSNVAIWVVLAAFAVLGGTNGLLSTALLMGTPKEKRLAGKPASITQQASALSAVGLLLGISAGVVVSAIINDFAGPTFLACYSPSP